MMMVRMVMVMLMMVMSTVLTGMYMLALVWRLNQSFDQTLGFRPMDGRVAE